MIDVHLYGKLRRFTGDTNPRIGIPPEELGRNIFLNGEVSALERTVKDGDRLGIFPDDMQLLYRQYFPKKGGDEG